MRINKIALRKILNSGGKIALESEVTINNIFVGIGSSPSAVIPGNREKPTTLIQNNLIYKLDENTKNILNIILAKNDITQKWLDGILQENIINLGSDFTLAVSLAFARANANFKNTELINYIENEANIKSFFKAPFPLATIFSGGIHDNVNNDSFQNIMIVANTNDFFEASEIILTVYNEVEKYLNENRKIASLGNSSGFIVKELGLQQQFEIIINVVEKYGLQKKISLAIDVAAEHLFQENTYIFHNKKYFPTEFYDLLNNYNKKYNINFIEDPFDTNDITNWKKLKANNESLIIVADDLFATQSEFIDNRLANAMLIKMNQAGTLTKTLETVRSAKNNGLKTCVSHRSYETEDTFMCDLAVAINSDYIKIGGPKRGDRISKYNRLLRLIDRKMNS